MVVVVETTWDTIRISEITSDYNNTNWKVNFDGSIFPTIMNIIKPKWPCYISTTGRGSSYQERLIILFIFKRNKYYQETTTHCHCRNTTGLSGVASK